MDTKERREVKAESSGDEVEAGWAERTDSRDL